MANEAFVNYEWHGELVRLDEAGASRASLA